MAYLLKLSCAHDIVRMRDGRGNSAAHDAAGQGHMDCLKLLVDEGLEVTLRDVVSYQF